MSIDTKALLGEMASRNPGRTEADLQSMVRSLLLYGGFDLGDEQVRLEAQTSLHTRIDVEVGAVVIECKKDLRSQKILSDAEVQLAGYLVDRERASADTYAGILTDGAIWRLYRSGPDGAAEHLSTHTVRPGESEDRELRWWLGAVLATQRRVSPTEREIRTRLGADSPAFALSLAELRELWAAAKNDSCVQLKRSLWARLLMTALGTQFEDDDELFVDHTYLVLTANLIGHAVTGWELATQAPGVLLSGQLFAQSGITGVGEAGFFDWVLDVEGGDAFVRGLARRVGCFEWADVDHDLLKVLYESVIDAKIRKRLGEYYTPDWLAERIVDEVVNDPAHMRVLDPACGSGTFVFHAARRHLDARLAAGDTAAAAVASVSRHVFGIDLHPVAVALAQVTFLLAIGKDLLAQRAGPFSVPVYLGDSLRWDATEESMLSPIGDVVVHTTDGAQLFSSELRFPAGVVSNVARFDQLVIELCQRASSRARGSKPPNIDGLLANFAVAAGDRAVIDQTFALLCELHDQGRDHIWGFYVRNQARPTWFSWPANRVDALVGNPPWLRYNEMSAEMQAKFKERSQSRSIWAGGRVATHQDLSGFFAVRSIERTSSSTRPLVS